MPISIFHLFSIGVGPSSSHTVGPMRAAHQFVCNLQKHKLFHDLTKIKVDLYGSLALTGKGHATDIAILLGLEGELPEKVDPSQIALRIEKISQNQQLLVNQSCLISFQPELDLIFNYTKQLPYHPNAMRFRALSAEKIIFEEIYYSLGGGFIIDHSHAMEEKSAFTDVIENVPYYFETAKQLLQHCKANQLTIAELMMENEKKWRSQEEVKKGLLHIWQTMQNCVTSGCKHTGILPGGLGVKRRAPAIFHYLSGEEKKTRQERDQAEILDWVSLWALAVNEENAAGGRVVTAPTNGAAGVIPAVIHYYQKFVSNATEEGIVNFLLVAGAVGILYKKGASISAAEMGCMGEVGVACSMAAAGLCAAMGGTNEQIENAAEIGMEHHLGLTCDPVAGLVQIPCIERNTMGAAKAITAARLAFIHGEGAGRVSLDQVIATMKQTGIDMKDIYKETSLGGLAVNVPFC